MSRRFVLVAVVLILVLTAVIGACGYENGSSSSGGFLSRLNVETVTVRGQTMECVVFADKAVSKDFGHFECDWEALR